MITSGKCIYLPDLPYHCFPVEVILKVSKIPLCNYEYVAPDQQIPDLTLSMTNRTPTGDLLRHICYLKICIKIDHFIIFPRSQVKFL